MMEKWNYSSWDPQCQPDNHPQDTPATRRQLGLWSHLEPWLIIATGYMNYPYFFHLTKKSQQDKNNYNPQKRICQGRREGRGSQHLQIQRRVKNPGHASLERKNAFADGLGQIIFTLDAYRRTTWTSYLIKSRVALDPPLTLRAPSFPEEALPAPCQIHC